MEALELWVVWWNTASAVIFWLERLILEQYGRNYMGSEFWEEDIT